MFYDLHEIDFQLIAEGNMADLVDSSEIMKEVSLKDLKNSLATSVDVVHDLGIDNMNKTLGMTDSQVSVTNLTLTWESCKCEVLKQRFVHPVSIEMCTFCRMSQDFKSNSSVNWLFLQVTFSLSHLVTTCWNLLVLMC